MTPNPDSQPEPPPEPTRQELLALLVGQAAEIAALKGRIAELERRLGLNSSNSGKPPSSDGLNKPVRDKRTNSTREQSGKPPGGQRGHKGWTLRQVGEPDSVVDHFASSCAACGAAVTPAMSSGHRARQVFDLPEPRPLLVTEHRAHDCVCTGCGAHTRAAFPDGVNTPVQYGPRIAAFVVYLLHYQLLPEDRLAELMADLFGVKLVAATIARISRTDAARLQDFAAAVESLHCAVPFKVQARADLITSETARSLRRSGCAEVWMGVESGSQKVLDAMDKGLRVEEVISARENLKHEGIRTCYFLQLGYPGEQWKDIQKTITVGILNRRAENDRAPVDTTAVCWRWHNGSCFL